MRHLPLILALWISPVLAKDVNHYPEGNVTAQVQVDCKRLAKAAARDFERLRDAHRDPAQVWEMLTVSMQGSDYPLDGARKLLEAVYADESEEAIGKAIDAEIKTCIAFNLKKLHSAKD